MSQDHTQDAISRRTLFRQTALSAAGLLLMARTETFAQEKSKNPYAPFRMGIQSYSLRGYKLGEALEKTRTLGLTYWEAWNGHIPITDDPKKITEYLDMLKANGITLVTYGVIDFKNDEKDARSKFEFAKAMGIANLSAYPSYDALPLLTKLTEEYRINIAIHNHGPGDNLYDKIEKMEKAFQGQGERVGSCCDTGHYIRSDEDPVEAVRKFGKRVYGCHLKDVKVDASGGKQFTEIGKGKLNTVELLKTLRANRYRGIISLEYEEHVENPMAYIEECLGATREAITRIRANKLNPRKRIFTTR